MGLGTCNEKLMGTIKEGPVVHSEIQCNSPDYDMIYDRCYNILVKIDTLKKTNYICRGKINNEFEESCNFSTYDYNPCIYDPTPVTGNWRIATETDLKTSQLKCTQDGALVSIKSDSLNQYVCDKNEFRQATEEENMIGLGCTDYTHGKKFIPDGLKSYFTCSYGIRNEFEYDWDETGYAYFWGFAPHENQGTMTDPRDSTVYKTINIGSKTWMMENLNYADSANYPSMLEKNKCEDDNPSSCKKYGRLYTWSAAIDSVYWASKGKTCRDTMEIEEKCELPDVVQGICPKGWHVPNFKDWHDFESWMSYFATTDTYRFDNFISTEGKNLTFCTSTNSVKTIYYISSLKSSKNYRIFSSIEPSYIEPENAHCSVRCVKDE